MVTGSGLTSTRPHQRDSPQSLANESLADFVVVPENEAVDLAVYPIWPDTGNALEWNCRTRNSIGRVADQACLDRQHCRDPQDTDAEGELAGSLTAFTCYDTACGATAPDRGTSALSRADGVSVGTREIVPSFFRMLRR
jgi:hypothetical protein